MNYKEYISELSVQSGYTQAEVQDLVSVVIETMGSAFVNDNSVSVPTFGTFEVKKRLERIVVNPISGKRMLVPPKLVLNFKPSTAIKDRLKSKGDKDE